MNSLRHTLLIGGLAAALLSGGCANYNVQNATPVGEVQGAHDIDPEYLVQVGDTVRVSIRTYDDPTNADVTEVIVRPDGKVFFPLIEDEILLAGYTPRAIRDTLREAYSEFLKDPVLTVNISSFGERQIYVLGEVRDIRERFVFERGMTAMRAVSTVGLDTVRGDLTNVIVVRQTGNGHTPDVYKLNLKKALTNVDPRQDIALRPSDVVFVPPKGLVAAADVMRQINDLVPLPGFVYPVGVLEYANAREIGVGSDD